MGKQSEFSCSLNGAQSVSREPCTRRAWQQPAVGVSGECKATVKCSQLHKGAGSGVTVQSNYQSACVPAVTKAPAQLSPCSGISECEAAHHRRCPRPGLAVHSWKSSYIRQHRIESNWRKGDGREPMVPFAAQMNPTYFCRQIGPNESSLSFFFHKGVKGSRRPRDNVSAVQRRPDRQRL